MDTFESVDAVLDFAIAREQESVDFYGSLAVQAENPVLKNTLLSFARVEQQHKTMLIAAKDGARSISSADKVVDMKIADYLVDVEPGPDMSLQDAVIVAIKREQAAMELYEDLVHQVDDTALRELFAKLAHEEGTHKLSFESLYEKQFMAEN